MCIDWSNFISTLVGAFAGALGAYCFNLKQADKQQKEIEKAKLLKLFYDINILIKIFVYHHENIVAEINNLTESEVKSMVPITIKDSNFNIDEYGFLNQCSPLLYEILTYVRGDINYILEQQDIISNYDHPIKSYMAKLEHIEVSTVKLLAKLFVSLVNINNALVKFYECENLIKDEVVNGYIRAKKILNETKKDYKEMLNDPQVDEKYDEEEIKTIKVDLEYINEIVNTWVIDFGLKSKQKTKIEAEIQEQVQKRWEVPENDL